MARRNGAGLMYRQFCVSLGLPEKTAGTVSDGIHGRPGVPLEMDNTLLAHVGLPCIGTMEVPVCPSCGGDHRLTDCGGQRRQAVTTSDKRGAGKRRSPRIGKRPAYRPDVSL